MYGVRIAALALTIFLAAPVAATAQEPKGIVGRIILQLQVDASVLHPKFAVTQKGAGTTITLDKPRFLAAMKLVRTKYRNYTVRGLVIKVTSSKKSSRSLSYSYRFSFTYSDQQFVGTVEGAAHFVRFDGQWLYLKDDSITTLGKAT
jgi:hypothetical protein